MACVTCEFVNSTLFVFYCLVWLLGFVSWCNVVVFLKAVPMFVCFSYFWAVVGECSPDFLSFSSVWV